MPPSPFVSIIIPVLNESSSIVPTLEHVSAVCGSAAEVIVVDGGSSDDTLALASPLCDQLVVSERGRADQMNRGAVEARGEVLLFLHADTSLPDGTCDLLQDFVAGNRAWGRFDVRLSGERVLFRVIAATMNLRSRLTGIATGDQAIFVRRALFEDLAGYRKLPLMEDIDLCQRLRRVSRPFCIRRPVVTDSRRWEQQGAWHTIVLMWRLRWRYWRGADPAELASAYRSDVRRHSSGRARGASDR